MEGIWWIGSRNGTRGRKGRSWWSGHSCEEGKQLEEVCWGAIRKQRGISSKGRKTWRFCAGAGDIQKSGRD